MASLSCWRSSKSLITVGSAHSMNMCASTLELFVALWSWHLPIHANEGRPFGRGRSSIRSRLSLWSVCLVVVGWLAMTCKTVCYFSCNLSQTKKGELNVSRSRLPVLLATRLPKTACVTSTWGLGGKDVGGASSSLQPAPLHRYESDMLTERRKKREDAKKLGRRSREGK